MSASPYQVGVVIEVEVVKISEFGLFVKLPDGQEGLVHISKMTNEYVKNASDYASVGDVFKVKVLTGRNGRQEFSARDAEPLRRKSGKSSSGEQAQGQGADGDFEERLRKFMISSDRLQADFRRNREARRTGKKLLRPRR